MVQLSVVSITSGYAIVLYKLAGIETDKEIIA
jgi:hypothetical protein